VADAVAILDGRRYVLEAWANPALWDGVLYREVRP